MPSDRLFNRGYVSLLAAQFLGAANDNILKQCITLCVATGGIWFDQFGEGGQAIPTICMTLPFIFLSGYGGFIADRVSKRSVILGVKIAEIPIAVIALFGFLSQNLWLALGSLVLLSIQSAFFGPAKYGVIPELIADKHLSLANGLINMFTNLAVIAGSLAAGPLIDAFYPTKEVDGVIPDAVTLAPGVPLVCVAIVGLVSVIWLPRLVAANPQLKLELNPFRTYYDSLVDMAKTPVLLVTLAWSGFYLVGALALLIIPEYRSILEIDNTKTSLLLGVLGVTIAIGSVSCGIAAGKEIRPWFVPFGAAGMTAAFLLLGTLRPTYLNVSVLIGVAGVSAGFYIVPLQALMQSLSPDDERGRFLGTANALSFCFITLASLIFLGVSKLGMPPNRIHLICGALAFVGTYLGISKMRNLRARRLEQEVREAS